MDPCTIYSWFSHENVHFGAWIFPLDDYVRLRPNRHWAPRTAGAWAVLPTTSSGMVLDLVSSTLLPQKLEGWKSLKIWSSSDFPAFFYGKRHQKKNRTLKCFLDFFRTSFQTSLSHSVPNHPLGPSTRSAVAARAWPNPPPPRRRTRGGRAERPGWSNFHRPIELKKKGGKYKGVPEIWDLYGFVWIYND